MRDYVPPRLWMSNVNYGVSSLYHNHMLFVINTLSFHFQHGTPAAISHIKSLLNIESLCTWQQNCKISKISLCLNRRNDANSVSQVSKHQPKACQFGLSPCDPGIGLVSLWKQRSGGGGGGGGGGQKNARCPEWRSGIQPLLSADCHTTVTQLCVSLHTVHWSGKRHMWLWSVTFTGIITLTWKNKHSGFTLWLLGLNPSSITLLALSLQVSFLVVFLTQDRRQK